MMRTIILIFLITSACTDNNVGGYKADINAKMAVQQAAWNNGDIEQYMQAYWKNDSLLFIGSRGLSYGWEKVLNNYKKGYPSTKAMGKLSFQNLEFRQLGSQHVWLAGKWTLHRKTDTLSGHYTLVWKKINGKWFIISDHSS